MLVACSGGSSSQPVTEAAQVTQPPQATQAPALTDAPQPTSAPAATDAPQETQAPAAGGAQTYTIDPSQSTAHFLINEVLFGQPKLVDGVTSQVEGQITADLANPASTSLSPIKVDLSGLTTDSPQRTGTLQRSILETGDPANQFAVFTPTKLDGLPSQVTVGAAFSFKITGSLALHGVTKDVTFDATVTPVSAAQLSGTASTTVTYADWNVQILRLPPQVASVEDHVILKLDFVANAS